VPRYFFHVQDGRAIPDLEGTELADIGNARQEAVQFAGAMLKDQAAEFWTGEEWYMEVHDQTGTALFTLRFSAAEGAANKQADGRAKPAF
jgi:hypothetical protein